MRRTAFLCAAFPCFGCSSSSDSPPPTPTDSAAEVDAVVDAPAETKDAPVDRPPVSHTLTCGPGPYRSSTITLSEQGLRARGLTLNTAAKVTFSACAASAAQTDEEGFAGTELTIGTVTSTKLEAPGFLTTIWQELTVKPWSPALEYTLLRDSVKKEIPDYAADKPSVLVYMAPDLGAFTGCALGNDVTLEVEGHPEAKIVYHAETSPFGPTSLTKTTASGLASISGLAAGTKVKIKGTKPTCDVAPATDPGLVPLEAGAVSIAVLSVRDPLPTCGSPPYIRLAGTVTTRELDASTGTPLQDVELTFTACPGVSVKTDKDGAWAAYVSTDMPVGFHYGVAGYISVNSTEYPWPYDYTTLTMSLRNKSVWATPELMPGFDDTHGFVSLGVAGPKTGTCSKLDGITFTVKQPDAKIVYTDGEPPKAVSGTSTAKRGSAYITGLKAGSFAAADITATKTGCTLTAPEGKARTAGGELTLFTLEIK